MAGERAGTALGCALIDEQRLHDGGFHTAHVHSEYLRALWFIEGQDGSNANEGPALNCLRESISQTTNVKTGDMALKAGQRARTSRGHLIGGETRAWTGGVTPASAGDNLAGQRDQVVEEASTPNDLKPKKCPNPVATSSDKRAIVDRSEGFNVHWRRRKKLSRHWSTT